MRKRFKCTAFIIISLAGFLYAQTSPTRAADLNRVRAANNPQASSFPDLAKLAQDAQIAMPASSETTVAIDNGTMSESSSPTDTAVSAPADTSSTNQAKSGMAGQTPPSSPLTQVETMFAAVLPAGMQSLRQYGYAYFRSQIPVTTATVSDDYVVGPGDVLIAYFWGDPVDINAIQNIYDLTIDRDGTIFFPPIGRISVWGQSLSIIRDVFRSTLAKKFKRLDMSMTLGRLREFPVYVSGFVETPGIVGATAVDSLFNVLAKAGGILSTGSLRKIQITHRDNSLKEIDLYAALINGKNVDLQMHEGDTVLVRAVGPVVGIAGQVRRPAIYELNAEKDVGDLLALAGGALPSAYNGASFLVGFEDQQRQMRAGDISKAEFLRSVLADGDLLYVSSVNDFIENAVQVEGAVLYPGSYALESGNSLRAILHKAQLLPNTNLRYARIYRITEGGQIQNRSFAPEDLSNDTPDITLKPRDRIVIYKYGDLGKAEDLHDFQDTIQVEGPIRYPGMYHRKEGMTLSSIVTEDQLLPQTNPQYARILRHDSAGKRPNVTFNPKELLSKKEDFALEPLDRIQFFKNAEAVDAPDFNEFPDTLVMQGAVRYPNLYHYEHHMTLASLLEGDQLLPSTSIYYGNILRSLPGGVKKKIPFIPKDILSKAYDIDLEPMDIVTLLPLTDTTRTLRFENPLGPGSKAVPSPAQATDSATTTTADSAQITLGGTSTPPASPQAIQSANLSISENPELTLERLQSELEYGEVLVLGELKYTGIYGYRPELKLSSILTKDQLLPETNQYYGQVLGYTPEGRKRYLTFIPKDILVGTDDLVLEPLDTIIIYRVGYEPETPVFDNFPNTVVLTGPIRYPGLYGYDPKMKLSSVLTSEQILMNTNMEYGEIVRRSGLNGTLEEILTFAPADILAGKSDLPLMPMDTIRMLERRIFKPISISGEVSHPLVVPYYSGMTVLTLLQSVDFSVEAKLLKLRIVHDKSPAEIHYLSDILGKADYPAVTISPGDQIIVQRLENNEHQPQITIKGEVAHPQTFEWRNGMKFSDLIVKAGGYTKQAYPKAIVLVRKNAAVLQGERINDLSRQIELAIQQAEKRTAMLTENTDKAAIAALQSDLEAQQAQLIALRESHISSALGRIILKVPDSLEALRGSPEDITLDQDDTVFVPTFPSYVLVVGAVNNQIALAYKEGMHVHDVLKEAGWATSSAQVGEAYLIRANGSIVGRNRNGFTLFSTSFSSELLGPGDTLVVPMKTETSYLSMSITKDIIQMVTQVVGSTVSTLALIRAY
jgi:protein involved in polysaccharide export with SLBB domain